VKIGYFAQDNAEMLDPGRTALEEIMGVASVETAPRVRSLLGAFLSGDAVEKRVGVLSGGERSRLASAKLLVEPGNCLLLDEPTKPSRPDAKEVLLEALLATPARCPRRARSLSPRPTADAGDRGGRGRAVRYLGNYEDYLRAKASQARSRRGAVCERAEPSGGRAGTERRLSPGGGPPSRHTWSGIGLKASCRSRV